ncbi:cupin domain-containing protein [Clostridium sediminicola]|uniref:cupin domain-containing protein n=1 Tax=Clostridium sediminicola TaxID=3114879 RepID=UPI0031F271A1
MIKLNEEILIEEKENFKGGEGKVTIQRILNKEELNGKCGIFAKVTLPKNSSIGYHVHEGNSETYYIINGKALADDNGVEKTLEVGDTIFTPSGSGHAIKNIGEENLVFMALVINS